MSAARKSSESRPPRFTAYHEVEVDVDPEDLEAAGWVYVGKKGADSPIADDLAVDLIRRWHDDVHDGPWRWCQHVLCDSIRGRGDHT